MLKVKRELNTYLQVAIDAALGASKYLSKNSRSTQIIEADKAHDLKLKADRLAEAVIIDSLKQHTNFFILGEESGLIKGKVNSLSWVVDPLDGTINYSRQIPFSCVSIALCFKNTPILGVIYDVNRKELFTGIVGQGAQLNGCGITVSSITDKEKALLATGFPSGNRLLKRDILRFEKYLKTYKKLRLFGSAALSMAYVACGRVDAYYEKDIMFWDVAAGVAIINAAGGKVRMKKTEGQYAREVFAHNGHMDY